MAPMSSHGMLQDLSAESMICAARWEGETAGEGMPSLEAPETTESSEPSGTAGATSPGTGTLAGASMALAGTLVPSGRLCDLSEAATLALVVTRLAVHTPEKSASGTSAIAFVLRDIVRAVVAAVMRVGPSPGMPKCAVSP